MAGSKKHREIEVRFLEVDKTELIKKLRILGAEDLGENLLEEVMFYDKNLSWKKAGTKIVRLRKTGSQTTLAYKELKTAAIDGTEEVEFGIHDFKKAKLFLERVGLVAFRVQEKRRHTFKIGGVIVDIDTWPKVPTFVEFEGPSETAIKKVAVSVGFDWSERVLQIPRQIIEEKYGIPVRNLRYFTFKKIK